MNKITCNFNSNLVHIRLDCMIHVDGKFIQNETLMTKRTAALVAAAIHVWFILLTQHQILRFMNDLRVVRPNRMVFIHRCY